MNNIGRSIVSIIGVIVFSLILIVSSKFIFKGGFLSDKYNKGLEYYKGVVTDIVYEDLESDEFLEDVEVGFQTIAVEITDGSLKGQEFEIGNPVSRLYNIKVEEGGKPRCSSRGRPGFRGTLWVASRVPRALSTSYS